MGSETRYSVEMRTTVQLTYVADANLDTVVDSYWCCMDPR